MNNTFIVLAFSIFIFLIIILTIVLLALNSKKNKSQTNLQSTNESQNNLQSTNESQTNLQPINESQTNLQTTNESQTNLQSTNNSESKQNIASIPSIYNDYVQDPNYNSINIEYQILGTLSSTTNDPETVILPLYGKRVKSYRWKYYTIVNSLKLDINKDNDSCMKECEMLANNDIVKIPAYNNISFKVYLYDYRPPF